MQTKNMSGAMAEKPGVSRGQRGFVARKTVVAIVVVALCAGAGGFVGVRLGKRANNTPPAEQTQPDTQPAAGDHDVQIDVVLPDNAIYDQIRVPVEVTGTDTDGNSVNVSTTVNAAGSGLSLPEGTYTVMAGAGVFGDDGVYYDLDQATANLTVDEASASRAALSFVEVDEAMVSDEEISRACDALSNAGVDADDVAAIKKRATDMRNLAVSSAEGPGMEPAVVTTDANSQGQSSTHIETSYFSVDLPASWDQQVTVNKIDDTTVEVYDKETGQGLLSFVAGHGENQGDYVGHIVGVVEDGNRGVEMWITDYAALWTSGTDSGRDMGYADIDKASFDRLIGLETGGKMSTADLPDGRNSSSGDRRAGTVYCEQNILPTLKLK